MGKKLGYVFGAVFVLVGLLGFISNPIVGAMGYFHTDLVHNLIHLIIGIVLLVGASKGEMMSVKTIKIVGIIYLVLAVVGFFQLGASGNEGNLLGIAGSNSADNWLHLVLGVVMFAIATVVGKKSMSAPMSQM